MLGHGPVVALGHGPEHVDHFDSADLTDDHPVGVLPQRRPDTVGQGGLASAFDVGAPTFPHDLVRVEIRESVQSDLEVVLDRHHPLVRGDLVQ